MLYFSRQEQIDISFFNPNQNGSDIDLSNIPAPFQTNIHGVTVTGVAPANFGSIKLLPDGTPTLNGSTFPIIPDKQVKISHNVTNINQHQSALLLDNLAQLLGLEIPKLSDSSRSTSTTTERTTGSSIEIEA